MAHTVVGIDLGAHAVKFSLVEAGFRQSKARGAFAELVDPGELPLAERQMEALRRGLERLPPESTVLYAMPGELLTMRVLELPFSDPRKIDQVVGYELEGQIVHQLSDVIYDHQVLRIAGAEGTSVLVVAARIDDIGNLLGELGTFGVDPRAIYAAPLVYETLLVDDGRVDLTPVEGVPEGCRVIVDVGHLRTNVCIVQDNQAIFGRTILRGGAMLTAAIAEAYDCDEATAEEIKKSRAAIGAAATTEAVKLDALLREALVPLLREIRQTLASVKARVRAPLQSVLLTGGSAALAGLDDYLAGELELPVSVWDGGAGPATLEGDTMIESDSRFALAHAAAWAGARGTDRINLRKGPFVYKASLSILRQKAVHLGALAAAVVLAVTIDATMALGRLRQEREQLQSQLRTQTRELFGEEMSGQQVSSLLRRSFKDEMAQIPKTTAYDLLGEISRKSPSNDDVKLDVFELDIKPKKIILRGTVGSAAAVDALQTKLRTIDCVSNISTGGAVTEVSGGGKNFILTIETKC